MSAISELQHKLNDITQRFAHESRCSSLPLFLPCTPCTGCPRGRSECRNAFVHTAEHLAASTGGRRSA